MTLQNLELLPPEYPKPKQFMTRVEYDSFRARFAEKMYSWAEENRLRRARSELAAWYHFVGGYN